MVAATSLPAAAEYPAKPVTLVVPYKAGGSTETMAQLFSKALGRELGQKVVVRTRPGAGGAVGSTYVSKAPADGYTIMFVALAGLTWDPLTKKGLEFDLNSFRYIAGVTEYQMAFITTPDKPYGNLAELIAYSGKGNSLNVADQGGISKAFINYIAKKEGIDWTAIPTRGGGEMVPFLLGGKVDFAYSGGVHGKYGDKMLVLASCLGGRLAASPEVPSIKELYGIAMPGNAVIVAPKGVSDEVAAKLEGAIQRAMNDPDFTKILGKLKFPKKFVDGNGMKTVFNEVVASLKKVVAATRN
ncbi:MAG: tripartite tricarboxylate transporter substrate binding protein [Alphaproteobacteria bacterium]|nr:tripartite tricarboxylate transporter substrate binding protein [Alphaproteobacteria bacterium]MDP6814559.1 tripartite tricarboxylate transporter substrate binding protein [Alphaproteobacteria bacterium]